MSSSAPQSVSADQFAQWIEAAQNGSEEALGHLLEACRPFLLDLARPRLHPDLRPRVALSDVVQDTFVDAHKAFHRFHGSTESELRAWLRCILLSNVAQSYVHHHRQKRDVGAEVHAAEFPNGKASPNWTAPDESPSSVAGAHERDESLQRALDQLPEAYRLVIQLHSYERCTFEETGRRMGRSEEATRKLWARAIDKLRELLEAAS